MAVDKYFLIGAVDKKNAAVPNNTIINNFTMYDTKAEADAKTAQLMADDRNLRKVYVCQVKEITEEE